MPLSIRHHFFNRVGLRHIRRKGDNLLPFRSQASEFFANALQALFVTRTNQDMGSFGHAGRCDHFSQTLACASDYNSPPLKPHKSSVGFPTEKYFKRLSLPKVASRKRFGSTTIREFISTVRSSGDNDLNMGH